MIVTGLLAMSGSLPPEKKPVDKAKHQDSLPMVPFMQRCSENKRDAVNRASSASPLAHETIIPVS
jgi:hypothetical protein